MLAKTIDKPSIFLGSCKTAVLFSPLEAFTDSHVKLPIFRAEVTMLKRNLLTLANFSFHTIIYNILYLQIKCRIHTFKQH